MSSIQGRPVNWYGSIIREESDDERLQDDLAVIIENRTVSRKLVCLPRVKTSLNPRFLQKILWFYSSILQKEAVIL